MAELDRTPLSDASKPPLMETLNARYQEALKVYAKHFCGAADAASARIIDIRDTELALRYWDSQDNCNDSVIAYQSKAGYPTAPKTAGDVRRILVDMASIASETTGDKLTLPCRAAIGFDECPTMPGAYLLNDLVDMGTLECLNQDDEQPVTNAVSSSLADAEAQAEVALQSDPDVDHQLLIKIGFRQPVKLKAITFRGCSEDETAPQSVKVFQGQMSIGFQEAEDQEAVQTLELSANQVDTGEAVALRFVKFQNVSTLQLFVQSNFGADVTSIKQLSFWGTPTETVDMKAWKPLHSNGANPVAPVMEPAQADPM